MRDTYYALDDLIRREIDKGQNIAIYPMGRIGLQARYILENRYGREGIFIDNQMAQYNQKIIDINQFEELDDPNITIILCTLSPVFNKEIIRDLETRKIQAHVKNIFNTPLIEPEKKDFFETVKKLCQVKKCQGHELVRVGSRYDGGYVMLNDFKNNKLAYSFGIGNDATWEAWMADRQGIIVNCYDHTIKDLPIQNSRLHFHKIGISGEIDRPEDNLLSMDSILHENHHETETELLLKMDVEGAEWEFFQASSSEMLRHYSQMTFELHGMINMENSKQIIAAFEKINKTHQVVWIHGNNNGLMSQAGEIVMPDVLEVTYASRERYKFTDTAYNCPLEIDAPNFKGYPDIRLEGWGG